MWHAACSKLRYQQAWESDWLKVDSGVHRIRGFYDAWARLGFFGDGAVDAFGRASVR